MTELLSRVNVPTLVMHKRDDQVQPFEAGRELAAGFAARVFWLCRDKTTFRWRKIPKRSA